ncbi:MAG: NAD(P)/FAD-dependent oxidoreductase [bacterium]
MDQRKPILVIGGGAAGIIAAWKAASLGAEVILIERNKKPGIKLLISGGGKCNITHAGPMEDVFAAFIQKEARFLKPSFYKFSNDDVVRMIEERGVKTFVRPNGRVFPVSGNADDVVNALAEYLHATGVEVKLNARVRKILFEDGKVCGVGFENGEIRSSYVILATGGASYPKTGTTGDGFRWAQQLGHTIIPVRPALAPIGVRPSLRASWRGIALRDGRLMVFSGQKKLFEWDDDMLFTHEGISGPAALEVSRIAAETMQTQPVDLRFDFFPGKEFQVLDDELNSVILSQRDKMIATILDAWLPNRIVPDVLNSIEIDPTKRGHILTRDERKRIVQMLKSWSLGEVSRIDIERGEVTAGGVALTEVDPKSMRSRKAMGLYVCGEILDIAGPVGGYNLQAAFSTGFVAGESAGHDWLKQNV